MKSLITGGCGFIGSHVVRSCKDLGHKVIALDDLSGGFTENLPAGVEFVQGSVTDVKLIESLFGKYHFDFVYHLAAYAAEGLSHFIRRFNYTNNTIGSINLINASVNAGTVKRFVFTSSIAVYGAGQLPMTEEMMPSPEDPYGISKLAVELDLKAAHEMFGLNYTIFRPHNVYGEFQNIGDKYRNVIGIFMNQIMKGEPLTVFGDGKQSRAFSYISNVAPLIADCINIEKSANQVFNIGADKPYSVLELAETVTKAFNVKPAIKHLDPRNEVVHAFSSHKKLEKVFGLQKYVPLAEGISRMAEWAKSAGVRESAVFSGIEIEKNMPLSWKSAIVKNDSVNQ
ncbi:MAG: NAD-dependent epimerase/dehydratase family protein [Chitinispirillaceae bacterium]|nr:NAD-dependent epimerase/dehydratase family protein [Chitinispirillaceae bacterium]